MVTSCLSVVFSQCTVFYHLPLAEKLRIALGLRRPTFHWGSSKALMRAENCFLNRSPLTNSLNIFSSENVDFVLWHSGRTHALQAEHCGLLSSEPPSRVLSLEPSKEGSDLVFDWSCLLVLGGAFPKC